MRLLVTGGRTFGVVPPDATPAQRDKAVGECRVLMRALDAFHAKHAVSVVIHGAADGADLLAGQWAWNAEVAVVECPADWSRYGRSAGPRRNAEMLRDHKPDAVLAFPGGRGTEGMVALALKAGVPVWRGLDGRIERA